MAQFDFDKVKEKVLSTAGRAADKSVEIAKVCSEKAKIVGRITKLRTEVAMEKDAQRKQFLELGKRYYETHKDNPAPSLLQAVEDLKLSQEAVTQKLEEIYTLKKELADNFEDTVEDLEEVIETVAEKAEEVVEEVKEVAEEVKEAVED